ncbi:hypothetical protein [Pseudobacter ginsenosidimutans]|uniref:Calx-beta domain-containing protein n=1 Tax=Pseudobacter ginsenosidimutans TaxID=661488 RepID=A0A4Q7N129_9BACT|nr:hypothetical protein [Pseudobacter ginsenosidimutans]QEC42911.1 hypothetical protein FSB84_14905 [Pseudobacter ginsenosidimutans]RZS74264.1 hypothetical protein EV199_0108 [Pseudobacter ginsenosidimutans]
MKLSRNILYLFVSVLLFSACSKNENDTYDLRYVHIMDNESSTVNISDKANVVSTYGIYLSGPQVLEPVTVTYKITVGDGLTEGVDYELINPASEVKFLPGIYDMPVRIRWMANPVDPAKNNTVVIELLSVSNPAFNLGLPGKDQLQIRLIITKFH